MKRIVLLTVFAIITLAVTACGASTVEPVRGTWGNDVFTSEYLGLRMVLPTGWNVSTDLEIAALMGISAQMMAQVGAEMPDDLDSLTDTMITSPFSGANIQISYVRLGRGRPPSPTEVIDVAIDEIRDIGGRATRESGTTRIGDYDWYSFRTELDMFGMTIYGRQFFNIYQGFIRQIVVSTGGEQWILDNPGAIFAGTSGALPQRLNVQRTGDLVGNWAWDADETYTYIFNSDRTGIRGWPGETDTFEWYIDGTNHLIIFFPDYNLAENWTYSVSGNVLTIDSRQAPGLTFSYIRR